MKFQRCLWIYTNSMYVCTWVSGNIEGNNWRVESSVVIDGTNSENVSVDCKMVKRFQHILNPNWLQWLTIKAYSIKIHNKIISNNYDINKENKIDGSPQHSASTKQNNNKKNPNNFSTSFELSPHPSSHSSYWKF